jgi:hypothetical protein
MFCPIGGRMELIVMTKGRKQLKTIVRGIQKFPLLDFWPDGPQKKFVLFFKFKYALIFSPLH